MSTIRKLFNQQYLKISAS